LRLRPMSADPFSAPAKGCPSCRAGDHFECWEEPMHYYDADELDLGFSCECAEGDHHD